MRRMTWVLGLAVVGLIAAGCAKDSIFTKNFFYQRPDIEGWYAKVKPGWTEGQVVTLLGKPTTVVEHEMFYIYDDPDHPVRLRFVLNDQYEVTQKFYETKEELAKKAAEAATQTAPPKTGEKGETYPGAPLPRFVKPEGEP